MTRVLSPAPHATARALASLAAILLFALASTGCTASSAKQSAPAPAPEVVIVRMDAEQARALIDGNFPVEVPVAQGEVVQGKAQGPDAWDYELRVAAPVDAVVAWYLAEYQRRGWQLADQQSADGVTRLTLRKGGAESLVSVQKSPVDEATVVRVILGVGAPVLETQ